MLIARGRAAGGSLGDLFADVRLLRTGTRFSLYSGRDEAAGREVTLKLANDDAADWVNDVIAREATILAALARAPHVVGLLERVDLEDGRPVLVLEHSVPLAETLAVPRMPAPDAVALGVKIAGALDASHAANVVHRGVRPQNIVITDAGEPALAGFDDTSRIGDPGAPLHATTGHTAPEILEGLPATERSDAYGLASTLYELIAGQAAFGSYAGESPAAIIVRVLGGRVRPIVDDAVPLELSDLLIWAMSADPIDRPPTPGWLADELSRLAVRRGWPRTGP